MKRFVVFIVLAMVAIGFCAAQSATNDAQRLVGTWVTLDGEMTLVFSANGTGTISEGGQTMNIIFWGVSISGEIYIRTEYGGENGGAFFLSPDGRRMFWVYGIFQKR